MNYTDAFFQSDKIRLPEWTGYWFKQGNDILVFTRTGDILNTPDYDRFGGRTDWEPVTEGLGFDFAILALKAGKKVAREGWNGKGMFLLVAGGYSVAKENLRSGSYINAEFLESRGVDKMEIVKHVDMWTAQNNYVSGWLASQTDMMATDWVVIP